MVGGCECEHQAFFPTLKVKKDYEAGVDKYKFV